MLAELAIGGGLAVLLVAALLRPWLGLLVLLALVPFNGLLLDVVGPSLHLSSTPLTMLGAWHDALAGGVILAAGVRWLRDRSFRLNSVEIAATLVLACGAVSLVISPHLQTGLYAYRTLFEPIVLALAIAVLARTSGMAAHVPSRYAVVMLGSAVVASLFAVWQVYGGGFHYLTTYYETPDGKLPAAYLASFILQPRAIGPYHSPNEAGAALVIALVIAATPGLILARPALRAWAAAAIGFAVLLSFSRSSWVSLAVATVALLVMLPVTRERIVSFLRGFATLRVWRVYIPPLAALLVLAGLVATSSGVTQFVDGTITGKDPSSAAHQAGLSSLLNGTTLDTTSASPTDTPAAHLAPFGIGLGMAGPKSGRFGQVAAADVLSNETWYVDYLWQAGYLGLLALLGLVVLVSRALWMKRRVPVARAALAAAAGLAIGAVFIPVLDEPAVAIWLWGLIGLGLAASPPTTAGASLNTEVAAATGVA